ncbi:rsmC [Symbiodinium natans]|uniref:RsmC protein n=1 Tax=Symbiodinium natans TaxID=878477 RepID=A0A812G1C8_9DINO|nr:rsmC [Symbiodinium natans]
MAHTSQVLHRQAFQLAADADQVAMEADEIATSTGQCIENLEELAEHLRRYVDEAAGAPLQELDLDKRQSMLDSNTGHQSARAAADKAGRSTNSHNSPNGPTWEAFHADRRAVLMERIALAEERCAAAEDEAKAVRLETMNRLAEMHRWSHGRFREGALGAASAASAASAANWRSEFEAFVCKQRAHADQLASSMEAQNETTAKLAESLASATSAVEASTPDARKYMQTLLSLTRALADSECRRRGLLVSHCP